MDHNRNHSHNRNPSHKQPWTRITSSLEPPLLFAAKPREIARGKKKKSWLRIVGHDLLKSCSDPWLFLTLTSWEWKEKKKMNMLPPAYESAGTIYKRVSEPRQTHTTIQARFCFSSYRTKTKTKTYHHFRLPFFFFKFLSISFFSSLYLLRRISRNCDLLAFFYYYFFFFTFFIYFSSSKGQHFSDCIYWWSTVVTFEILFYFIFVFLLLLVNHILCLGKHDPFFFFLFLFLLSPLDIMLVPR